jgi:hypothetical protein
MKMNMLKNKVAVGFMSTALAGLTAFAGSIGTGSFNLWWSCGPAPYFGSGGIIIPVANQCSPAYSGAQQSYCQGTTGMQFVGCFKAGSAGAYSTIDQEAVFMTDNVSSWTGHEMGFVKWLNDGSLRAYLQAQGGSSKYYIISYGDNGYHTFKCQCRSASQNSMVDYYVDGNYVCTLSNSGNSYWGNCCYMVGTTQRHESGWNSSGWQVEMYSMQYF